MRVDVGLHLHPITLYELTLFHSRTNSSLLSLPVIDVFLKCNIKAEN